MLRGTNCKVSTHFKWPNMYSITKLFFFYQFTKTSHHFHQVLRVLITLEYQILVQPNGSIIPSQMLNNGERFYPYFKVIYYIDIFILTISMELL
jgi:hypothetical protein